MDAKDYAKTYGGYSLSYYGPSTGYIWDSGKLVTGLTHIDKLIHRRQVILTILSKIANWKLYQIFLPLS